MYCLVEALCLAIFNFGLFIGTIPLWVFARIGLCILPCFPRSKQESLRRSFSWIVIAGTSIAWRLGTLLCFWVRIRVDGFNDLRNAWGKAHGKPRVLLSNHLSFADILFATMLVPLCHVGDIKMMASDHLFKMPILGGLVEAMRHLCVPFKSQGDGDFQVDREAMLAIMKQMEDWVMSGHTGCWFPEGQTNPGDPTVLQLFRAGGFAICVRNDVEIWCNVFAGNTVCWPRKAAVGGRPSKIHLKVFKLCDSSHAFLREANLPAHADESAKCLWMANRTRELCQVRLNEIVEEAWASESQGKEKTIVEPMLTK